MFIVSAQSTTTIVTTIRKLIKVSSADTKCTLSSVHQLYFLPHDSLSRKENLREVQTVFKFQERTKGKLGLVNVCFNQELFCRKKEWMENVAEII